MQVPAMGLREGIEQLFQQYNMPHIITTCKYPDFKKCRYKMYK
jgi:hypothetical protein